ncbi:S66 peptidase family protein [Lacinutrix cladophorae]
MTKKRIFLQLFCVVFFFGNLTLLAQDNSIKNTTTLIQPDYLKAGDTVAIVAPSGILKNRNDEVEQAIALLKSWNLNVVVGDHVFSTDNHFAGTDAERCEDFQKALDDPSISAIWSARGGYGTVRILDNLDYSKFKQKPKWVIGYSDITALHNQIHNEGVESIHALMCVSLTKDLSEIKESIATFRDAIFGELITYTLKGSNYNRVGEVTGPVVGGNLTILHTMLGSNTSIDTSGKILFIEEIGEYKYHIDRMLQSLKRAGYFENCKGVMVGDMSKMRKNTTPWGTSVEQLILDVLAEYDFPIVFNVPVGHEKDNRALILGRNAKINVGKDRSTVVFEE